MVKAKKEKDDGGPSSEEQAAARESKRLQELAVSRGLLSRSKANPSSPLLPTKTIRKCDGKDIVKKGQRKTKYLFAFPGLMAPIAGGKFGELTNLDSRNPTFYVDFPQGRLKLFGTIVYPKNKYLTMHFVPGRGDIVCEDCFESIVVFPEAWWIGTKEENPAELRLAMPSSLQQEKRVDVDFNAGAGSAANTNAATRLPRVPTGKTDPESPIQQFPMERLQASPSSKEIAVEDVTLRRSARKSMEKRNYAFSSSSDSQESSDWDSNSSDFKRRQRRPGHTERDITQSQQSSLSRTDANLEDKMQDAVPEQVPTSQTNAKKEIGTPRKSTGAEKVLSASTVTASLKQATLTSFLTKTDTFQASNVELIEIEESPQKAESGRTLTSRKGGARRRQSITEISSSDEDDRSKTDHTRSLDSL